MSHKSKKHRPEKLSGPFSGLIRDKGWERKFDQHRVFPVWKELVDDATAAHSRPLKVVKDVLWIEVENSAWMQQLQFQKLYLLETLNAYLKVSLFSDIRFAVQEKQPEETPEKKAPVRFVPPEPERVEQFRKQISFIDDENIRDSLLRLWYLSQACRKV